MMKTKTHALVLLTTCVGLGLVACAPAAEESSAPEAMEQTVSYWEMGVQELEQRMAEGELTSVELTRYFLDRIEELDDQGPELHAVLEVNPEALEIAAALDAESTRRGPLHGIPVLLKANIDTGDQMTTTAGSLALEGHRAQRDAFHVERLREAGAVILGKTNLSEWANFRSEHSSSGWSSQGRQTRNPHVLDRNPCGSSSGSAVAVAAGLAPLAIGTETDGSIVCPASANGVVGIKPTLGLVSRQGIIPIAHSQDTAGPMGRTVRDAAALLGAIVAADPRDPAATGFPGEIPDYLAAMGERDLKGLRIGVSRSFWGSGDHGDVERVFSEAIATLEKLGAEIVDPIEFPSTEGLGDAEYEVLLYEFKTDLAAYLQSHGSPNGMSSIDDLIAFDEEHRDRVMPYFGQEIFEQATAKGDLTEKDYEKALTESKRLAREAIDGVMKTYELDALVAPSNGPAWPTDLVNGDHFSVSSSTLPAVSGYPNVTVPMGDAHGLPLGLSIMGSAYEEALLIRIAAAFEQESQALLVPKFLPSLDLP